MRVTIGNQQVDLEDRYLLGKGGEGAVYKYQDPSGVWKAAKIYHRPDPSLPLNERQFQQLLLDRKIEKIQRFPKGLRPEVIAPLLGIKDMSGVPQGFSMDMTQNGEDMFRLTQVGWKDKHGISRSLVTSIFQICNEVLADTHSKGVIVGDLNDGNVQWNTSGRVYFIDADSMQIPGYPCIVAHEKYLDPRLYGVDLARTAALSQETDIYALWVLLFSSLCEIHPYGGTHNSYPSMLRRAEASYSVLKPDVVIPKRAYPFRFLPPDLLQAFHQVFDLKQRPRMDSSLLNMNWKTCPHCGKEYALPRCPDCQKGPAVTVTAVAYSGTCKSQSVFSTKGRILYTTSENGKMRVLYHEDKRFKRMTSIGPQDVGSGDPTPDMRFAISGDKTFIGVGNQVIGFEPDYKNMTRYPSGQVGHRTAFGANEHGLYTSPGINLVFNNRAVGGVMEDQTVYWVGPNMVFGFYQLGTMTHWLLHKQGDPLTGNLRGLPHIQGRLKAVDCYMDDRSILVLINTERTQGTQTKDWMQMLLLNKDGELVGQIEANEDDDIEFLKTTKGFAVYHGTIYVITDKGIQSLKADSGGIIPERLFTDTEKFVSVGQDLFIAGNFSNSKPSWFVVDTKEIKNLTMQ